ncbi:MAG: alpha/beta fold hydrolase [Acidobacteriota bacterium]|jgi:pimeloyl-ACP methyl ester carboxylesterase
MPEIDLPGVRLHYVERGSGAETAVFSHSYLVDHRHFEPQITALEDRYRILAYDHRDHGESEHLSGADRGPYGMEEIYADAVAFLEATCDGPVHWVGLSTGGFVGVRLGIRRPDLLRSLTLMDTSAEAEPTLSRLKYNLMLAVLPWIGFRPLIGETMKAMFGPRFLRDPERREERELWKARMMANDRRALVRFGRAIFSRDDVSAEAGGITVPTLVMVGERDRATPPARARRLAGSIPGARLEIIPHAGHLSTVEEPEAVNAVLGAFLDGCSAR